jgi:hypothetical protein
MFEINFSSRIGEKFSPDRTEITLENASFVSVKSDRRAHFAKYKPKVIVGRNIEV